MQDTCKGCGLSTCPDCCTLTREQLIAFYAEAISKVGSYAKTIYSFVETLDDILSRFPDSAILRMLTDDESADVRRCSIAYKNLPTVAQVMQWRKLTDGQKGEN